MLPIAVVKLCMPNPCQMFRCHPVEAEVWDFVSLKGLASQQASKPSPADSHFQQALRRRFAHLNRKIPEEEGSAVSW